MKKLMRSRGLRHAPRAASQIIYFVPRAAVLLMALFGALLLLPHRVARAGDDAPQWLKQAATAMPSGFDKDVPGVVLWDESRVTVDEDGRIVETNFYAIRILTREGRALARAEEGYQTDSGKVRELRAWLIRPSGEVRKYGKDETVDMADVDNDVYNEARSKVISAKDDAEPGAVFGYEATTEHRAMFNQLVWGFQSRLPVAPRAIQRSMVFI